MRVARGVAKIVLTGALIGFGLHAVWPLSAAIGSLIGDRDAGLSLVGLPLNELVKIIPAIWLGWTVKRHPLLWGAGAGLIGALILQYASPGDITYEPSSALGRSLALITITSISCFAGRALRQRFSAT